MAAVVEEAPDARTAMSASTHGEGSRPSRRGRRMGRMGVDCHRR